MLKLLVLTVLVVLASARHEQYEGYKLYKVMPVTDEQFQVLNEIEKNMDGFDYWLHPSKLGRAGHVMIPKEHTSTFETTLGLKGVEFELEVPNVKSILEKEDEILKDATSKSTYSGSGPLTYDTYHRYDAINGYVEYLAQTYPNRAKLVYAGNSFEGRPINYLRISTTDFDPSSNKPVIFIDGGIHAREWISPPVVTYILHKLLEDVTEPHLVEDIDWIVLPVVNPDGYEFTHTSTRLWRKTRSTGHIISNICQGVDGNRNYDFEWMVAGSSQLACSDVFAGPKPFSEPETQYVNEILLKDLNRIKLYLTMHSFGSYVLYGWGHDGSAPSNAQELHDVGQLAADAIDAAALSGSDRWLVGNSGVLLNYYASGASEDYALHLGVPLSYTLELPGRASWGTSGFELAPSSIKQVVEETWEGMIVFAEETLKRYGN